MKSKTLRIITAALLCCLLVYGSAGVYAAAKANDREKSLFSDVEASPAPAQQAPKKAAADDVDADNVYVIAGADGKMKKVIVTDGIKAASARAAARSMTLAAAS